MQYTVYDLYDHKSLFVINEVTLKFQMFKKKPEIDYVF